LVSPNLLQFRFIFLHCVRGSRALSKVGVKVKRGSGGQKLKFPSGSRGKAQIGDMGEKLLHFSPKNIILVCSRNTETDEHNPLLEFSLCLKLN